MQLTAILTPATEGEFIAMNSETGTHTQGESIAEALMNSQEATVLYVKEFLLEFLRKSFLTTIEISAHVP